MLELQKLFDEIDKIDDVETLVQMRRDIRDASYTKVFWDQWKIALSNAPLVERARAKLKCNIITKKYSASIAVNENVQPFVTPHGFAGIHVSVDATIGKGCTIFQHVVIGSNTLPDSKSHGFPVIGDNVFIGAGAMVIGNVHIGNNVRIGANCIVTKDVPDNCLVVGPAATVIPRSKPMKNKFVSALKYKQMIADGELKPGEAKK